MARSGLPAGGGRAGLARLIGLIDRYGPAIEYDLQAELGLDLVDFFRRRHSWAKLERLLDQLPRASRFRCAVADDDEVAESILAGGERPARGSVPPPLQDVDYHASLLMIIADRLGDVAATVIASAGGNPGPVSPLPRPVSALDRVQRRHERAQTESLNAEVYAAMERWTQQHTVE